MSEDDVDALVGKLDMHPIEIEHITVHYRNMPPYWWRPAISTKVRAFATANFPMKSHGSDRWHALATWNQEDAIVHMWIKDNF